MREPSLIRPPEASALASGNHWKQFLVAASLALIAWVFVVSPNATAERAVVKVASAFMEGEASADCAAVSRLSLSADPCADLQQRAFSFSMMAQTGRWHAEVEGANARAWTTLASNVPVAYELTRSDDRWFVVSGGVS